MTNGEKIKEIFPNIQTNEADGHAFVNFFINEGKRTIMSACGAREEWWNSEYKESEAQVSNKSDEHLRCASERWIISDDGRCICPNCGKGSFRYMFCPNCGALNRPESSEI